MAALLTLLVVGCSVTGGVFGRSDPPASAPVVEPGAGSAGSAGDAITVYLQTLRDLTNGDPVVQADAFRAAADAANAEPTTTNLLNLALAYAAPGHPGSNPLEAQRRLSELLARGDALLPAERTLATLQLKEVEQRLILDAEAQRFQQAAQAATARRNDESNQRLQAALDENRRLKAELDEARAKLDAITNIERSIRERENAATPQ